MVVPTMELELPRTCRLCDQPRHWETRKQPFTGVTYPYCHPWCEHHLSERRAAAKVLGLSEGFEDYLYRIPQTVVYIHHTQMDKWRSEHEHRDRNHGSIGGGFSVTTTPTSMGDMVTLRCGFCRMDAFVDMDW